MLKAEKFKKEIESFNYMFAVVENKVVKCADLDTCENCEFKTRCGGGKIKWLLEEYEEHDETILTKKEKKIVLNIIDAFKPFGDEIECISKHLTANDDEYYLVFDCKYSGFNSPIFTDSELFKNMKLVKDYTLEDLGL